MSKPPSLPKLYVVLEGCESIERALFVAEQAAAVAPDAVWIQLRERTWPTAKLLACARALAPKLSNIGSKLFINDRIDIALAAGADGVHLRENSISVADTRRSFPSLLVGRSTHSAQSAEAASNAGADLVLLGPIFSTPSKEKYGPPLGQSVLRQVKCPVIAIGGINEANIDQLIGQAHGLAANRAIVDAHDCHTQTLVFLEKLHELSTEQN